MKVCMLAMRHTFSDTRIFYKEAKSLQKDGYDVSVVGLGQGGTSSIDGIKCIKLRENAQKVIRLRIAFVILVLIRQFRTAVNMLREALKINADIYHCHEPESLLVATILKLFWRKGVIYDVHELEQDAVSEYHWVLPRLYRWILINVMEALFCRWVDAIVTVEDIVAVRYQKLNKNVCVVHNFPILDMFYQQASGGLPPEHIRNQNLLIDASGLRDIRGTFEVIQAMGKVSQSIPSAKLLLVGRSMSEEFRAKCVDYVRVNQLENNVDFVGHIPHTDISNYINAAKVGLITRLPIPKRYRKGCFPTKLLEYMGCAKPVVASDFPEGMGKTVNEAGCGLLVNPLSPDDITRAIIYLLTHEEEASRMGKRGRELVVEKYNWGSEEKKLLELYSQIQHNTILRT